MPRPGFVLEVDRSTPPILFHHGESLRLEKLPAGRSRVLYPGEPLEPLDDPEGAIREALREPAGWGPAAPGPSPPGHEAHDLLRRHLAAPATHAPARHPPTGDRGGARPRRRGWGGRRPPHRRPGPASPHDRGGAAPRRRRPGLRRLRPARPALQPRRRGPGQPCLPRHHAPGRGGRDQQAGGRERPRRLRQHQPGGHGRRPQVHRHRAGQLSQPAASPQRRHHAAEPQLHGPASLRAAQLQLAHGQGPARRGREDLPDRDHAQQRHVRHQRSHGRAAEAGMGVDAPATGPASSP